MYGKAETIFNMLTRPPYTVFVICCVINHPNIMRVNNEHWLLQSFWWLGVYMLLSWYPSPGFPLG